VQEGWNNKDGANSAREGRPFLPLDQQRSQVLQNKGIKVIRFWNNDVLENTEGVWDEISRVAATLSSRPATPTPTLPLSGGGSAQNLS
jgi:very-short-patch-repair endonuclease